MYSILEFQEGWGCKSHKLVFPLIKSHY